MQKTKIGNWSHGRKLFWVATAVLMISFLISSCGSGKKTANSAAVAPSMASNGSYVTYDQDTTRGESAQQESAAAPTGPNGFGSSEGGSNTEVQFSESTSTSSQQNIRKMIMDGNVSLETLKFDDSIEAMDRLIERVGGFAEVRTVRGKSSQSRALRSANYVIRVPADTFDAVLKDMGTIGTVLESNSKGTDITDQYYDSQTRVKTLKVQEETLLDILAKATKLEDVITLESRISDVRYEIESIENTLKNYDRLVSFSRITIYIQEVDDVTETRPLAKTLDQRISSSFTQSLQDFRIGLEDFLVWLVGSWITLLFLAILAIITLIAVKSRKRRKIMDQKAKMEEVKTENKE